MKPNLKCTLKEYRNFKLIIDFITIIKFLSKSG